MKILNTQPLSKLSRLHTVFLSVISLLSCTHFINASSSRADEPGSPALTHFPGYFKRDGWQALKSLALVSAVPKTNEERDEIKTKLDALDFNMIAVGSASFRTDVPMSFGGLGQVVGAPDKMLQLLFENIFRATALRTQGAATEAAWHHAMGIALNQDIIPFFKTDAPFQPGCTSLCTTRSQKVTLPSSGKEYVIPGNILSTDTRAILDQDAAAKFIGMALGIAQSCQIAARGESGGLLVGAFSRILGIINGTQKSLPVFNNWKETGHGLVKFKTDSEYNSAVLAALNSTVGGEVTTSLSHEWNMIRVTVSFIPTVQHKAKLLAETLGGLGLMRGVQREHTPVAPLVGVTA